MTSFNRASSRIAPTRKLGPLFAATFLLGMLIGGAGGGAIGILLFIRVTGANDQPSGPISAPTLSLDMLSTPLSSTSAISTSLTAQPTAIQTVPLTATPVTVIQAVTATSLAPRLFRIVSSESLARFSVVEKIPAGTAVGATNQIAGDLLIDFANPSNSRLGRIRINLRTLTTNNLDRDKSIRCCVLLTAQDNYEFTEFVPTSLRGLPTQVALGQTVIFQVTGDLSLRGVTRSVSFNVSLTLESMQTVRGKADTTVNRSDFGILDDNMLAYHGVAQQIALSFDFVARAQ